MKGLKHTEWAAEQQGQQKGANTSLDLFKCKFNVVFFISKEFGIIFSLWSLVFPILLTFSAQ